MASCHMPNAARTSRRNESTSIFEGSSAADGGSILLQLRAPANEVGSVKNA